MKCPFCGTDDTQVVDSRVNDEGNSIRRRRRCSECDKRFTTYESVELTLPQVVKQNGKREDFSRNKLHQSFSRALHKRCLLYTSDAADDLTRVDLGGRRIIKKNWWRFARSIAR